MFIIQLKFSTNKANASQFMDGHNTWLKDGFAKGTFLLAGTIQPKLGGAILAHNATLEQVQTIVKKDPFVAEGVVTAEVIEITPPRQHLSWSFYCNSERRKAKCHRFRPDRKPRYR